MPTKRVSPTTKKYVFEDALTFLKRCHAPKIREFIHYVNNKRGRCMLVGGPNEFLIEQIKKNSDKNFPAQDLVEFTDKLKESCFKHFFLFQLSKQLLKNKEEIENILEKITKASCFNKPKVIWVSSKPKLASIIEETPNIYLFKWVETRIWYQKIRTSNAKSNIVIRQKPIKERSVNYFKINLHSGEGELSIQVLRPNPKISLNSELEIYRNCIGEFFPTNLCQPIPLEPVIRNLLIAPTGQIMSWKISLPEGGILQGRGDPNLFQKLGLLLKPFVGISIRTNWTFGDIKRTTVLNGKTDEISIRTFTTPEHLATISKKVRKLSKDNIISPSLKGLAAQDEKYRPVLKEIDLIISILGENSIDCRRLIENKWASPEELLLVLEKLSDQHSDEFEVSYQIICPQNNSSIKNEIGQIVEYTKQDEIPTKLRCLHPPPDGWISHSTVKNIKPILIFKSPPPSILNDGIMSSKGLIDFLQKHMGKTLGRTSIKAVFFLCFTALYSALAWIIASMFLSLLENHLDQQIFVWLPYLIVLLLLTVLITALFGIKVVEKSITFFENIAKIIRGFFLNTVSPIKK